MLYRFVVASFLRKTGIHFFARCSRRARFCGAGAAGTQTCPPKKEVKQTSLSRKHEAPYPASSITIRAKAEAAWPGWRSVCTSIEKARTGSGKLAILSRP